MGDEGEDAMLERLHPARDVDRLLDEVDRLVTDGIGRARAFSRRHGSRPAIDLYDTGTELVVKALIPGAQPEDIGVAIEQNAVTLQGHFGYALSEEEDQSVVWYRREIVPGHFTEAIALPIEVEAEQATATFADGILTLTMPKVAQARSKRIPVHGQSGRVVVGPAR
jgi:HSP20 family protein